ncbi:hypothetical protein NL676_005657 [Syzygium grande]|nr:hypothetical protein NL676_005657 [Syzygium grande]
MHVKRNSHRDVPTANMGRPHITLEQLNHHVLLAHETDSSSLRSRLGLCMFLAKLARPPTRAIRVFYNMEMDRGEVESLLTGRSVSKDLAKPGTLVSE